MSKNYHNSADARLLLALSAIAVVASTMFILKRRKWTEEVEKRKAYRGFIARSTMVGSSPLMISTIIAKDERKSNSSISMLTTYHTAPEPIITAVILHGMGCTSLEFKAFLTQLKKKRKDVNIFCYDRVLFVRDDDDGSTNKSNKNTSRDANTLAMELHALLLNRNIPPPYLLVGHSYGGLVAQYFASLYTEKVQGMVLLDPAHERQLQCFPKDFGCQFTTLVPSLFKLYEKIAWTGFLKLLDHCGLFNFPPLFLFRNSSAERNACATLYSEGQVWKRAALELDGYLDTADQMNLNSSSSSMDNISSSHHRTETTTTDDTIRNAIRHIPTALVIAGHRQYSLTLFPKAVTQAFLDMHERSLPNARVFLADQSDHWIHIQQPGVVMEAVNFVLKRVEEIKNETMK